MATAGRRERRQSVRVKYLEKALYSLPGRPGREGQTQNLSDGGVLLVVSGNVRRNDLLGIEIPTGPGGELIVTRGRVVHVRRITRGGKKALAGIAFLENSERQRKAIAAIICREILRESSRFARNAGGSR